VSNSQIMCRISGRLVTGTYSLIVTVGGQASAPSIDQILVPLPPRARSVMGCARTVDSQTVDCPTNGLVRLTISGDDFQDGMVHLFVV
jgi:hypothetical protein